MPTKSTIAEIVLIASFIIIGLSSAHSQATETEAPNVKIEYVEEYRTSFDFSIKYVEWRNQIHIRSDKPLRSLELYTDDEAIKEYNIIGSELIVLPMRDFTPGQLHRLDAAFIDDDQVVQATIIVTDK